MSILGLLGAFLIGTSLTYIFGLPGFALGIGFMLYFGVAVNEILERINHG